MLAIKTCATAIIDPGVAYTYATDLIRIEEMPGGDLCFVWGVRQKDTAGHMELVIVARIVRPRSLVKAAHHQIGVAITKEPPLVEPISEFGVMH